jgi:hypothetical protein
MASPTLFVGRGNLETSGLPRLNVSQPRDDEVKMNMLYGVIRLRIAIINLTVLKIIMIWEEK